MPQPAAQDRVVTRSSLSDGANAVVDAQSYNGRTAGPHLSDAAGPTSSSGIVSLFFSR